MHLVGIILMLGCVLCISMAAVGGEEKEDFNSDDTFGLSQSAAGAVAVVCGLISACLMSTKHMFIRLYKSNYSGVDMGVDASGLEFIILSMFLIPLCQEEGFTLGIEELAVGSIAGILICQGRIFISIGVSVGLAGPAQSLMSTHSLHQAFWSSIIASQALNFLQVLGMILGLCGVFSISVLDHLANKYKAKGQLKKQKSIEAAEMAKLPKATDAS